MSDKAHADTLDLLPAYAMGSLDAAEAASVAEHLAQCASCRHELSTYETVVDALPLAAPDVAPPAGLRERLMTQVQEAGRAREARAPGSLGRLREAWDSMAGSMRWQPVALVLIALLAISNVVLWQRVNRVAEAPGAIVLMGTEEAPNSWGLLVPGMEPGTAILVVDGLPALEASQQYQLWLIRNGERDNGGVFSVSEYGYRNRLFQAPQDLADYTGFGVTIEPAGGSPGPTGPRVLGSG